MSQPLDLRITLLSAPENSPPDTVARWYCEMGNLTSGENLLTDPLTNEERNNLRWYLEEYWKWPYEQFAVRGKSIEKSLVDIGKRLYSALFGSTETGAVLEAWQANTETLRQISIVSDVPTVLSLPWELLHDEHSFLVLRVPYPISIVRRLPQYDEHVTSLQLKPPLRVLLVTARPKGTGFVDPRAIAYELLDEIQEQVDGGAIKLEFLRPSTLDALRERLQDQEHPVHILHFDGHGAFSEGQGALIFENKDGLLSFVKAHVLAQLLQQSGVRLVVLTACQSAMSVGDTAFSSVATQMIYKGVDAVIAMSTNVLVASATRYTEAFYRALVQGNSLPMAHERARQMLQSDPRRHLLHRYQDEEGRAVELQDWWLPHLYQQHPLTFQLPELQNYDRPLVPVTLLPRLSKEMPPSPRYGFTGRARELSQLERLLLLGKIVIIHGLAGVGKTAIAREAADWLTRTGMYARACFLSFEYEGNAITLLSVLGHFLGVYESGYHPEERVAALAQLAPILKQQSILIVADNLENILPGANTPLTLEERTALWETFVELVHLKVGIILTSRYPDVGDDLLEAESIVAGLPLKGLDPEDAYLLVHSLLNKLTIDRALVPYTELQDLLVKLAYHPMSIQLVFPALCTLSLKDIQDNFTSLLPQFSSDSENDRKQSLQASLEYLWQRLSDDEQALLSNLTFFEGRTYEGYLLAISEIPQSIWDNLRFVLEQTGLLTIERLPWFITPFLHFHPMFMPFLRSQCTNSDPNLYKHYAAFYKSQAVYLREEDPRHTVATRALVLRELPNFLHAFNILLEVGELESATELAECIRWFLAVFGRKREQRELWRQLKNASTQSDAPAHGPLTVAEYRYQTNLGEEELEQGNIASALSRFSALLARIEITKEDKSLGPGSADHCRTLLWLARCLRESGHVAAAEHRLREALPMSNALLERDPENHGLLVRHIALVDDLGNILYVQGKYTLAREFYEESLKLATKHGHTRSQAIALLQFGNLALEQQNYDEASQFFIAARRDFQNLGELELVAHIWLQLGKVAVGQKIWSEAQHSYREALIIQEQLGNLLHVANSYGELALAFQQDNQPSEAEGWYQRALAIDKQIRPNSNSYATDLSNFAAFLLLEVRANRAPKERLTEARKYAEQALIIKEEFDTSHGTIWTILEILSQIAKIEGKTEEARKYRRRMRESYVASPDNRKRIELQFEAFIFLAALATTGHTEAREKVEANLPKFEAGGWHITDPIQRIWAGERDTQPLVKDLGGPEALLIQLILEMVWGHEPQTDEFIIQQNEPLLEAIIAASSGDLRARAAVEASFPELEEKGWKITAAIQCVWAGERDIQSLINGLDHSSALLIQKLIEKLAQKAQQDEQLNPLYEPVVAAVLATLQGDTGARKAVEEILLPKFETMGWHIGTAIQRILAGERELRPLVEHLKGQEKLIIMRILERPTQAPMESLGEESIIRMSETLIAGVVAAVQGHMQDQEAVESSLPGWESRGWRITNSIHHIWKGKRDFVSLTAGLDREETIIIKEILKRIVQFELQVEIVNQSKMLITLIVAATRGDRSARILVEESLPELEKRKWHVSGAVQRILAGDRDLQTLVDRMDSSSAFLVSQFLDGLALHPAEHDGDIDPFKTLITSTVAAAKDNGLRKTLVEAVLLQLEVDGWHISDPIHRIWAGARDEQSLVSGLDDKDTLLVKRVLTLLTTASQG